MNLGPTPNGDFLKTSIEKLERVGHWLQENSESIFEAEKGPHYFLDWGTCTQKDNTLYYHIFEWPINGKLMIPGLETKVKKASFLADINSQALKIKNKKGNVYIQLPEFAPYKMANVIKVELTSKPVVDNSIRAKAQKLAAKDAMREIPEGGYFLSAAFADIHGEKLHFNYGTGAGAQRENLQGWTKESDWADWKIKVVEKRRFNIEVTYGSWLASGTFEVEIAGHKFKYNVNKLDLRGKPSPLKMTFKTFLLGEINIETGSYKLKINPIRISKEAKQYHQGLMKLRNITLTPL